MIPPPPRSTLFPYTTLFRSELANGSLLLLAELDVDLRLFAGCAHVPHRVEWNGRFGHDDQTVGEVQAAIRSEEHTSELQSQSNLVCRLLLEKKKKTQHSSNK